MRPGPRTTGHGGQLTARTLGVMRTVFLLFDGMDLMDFAGPFEALLTANRLRLRAGGVPPFSITTVSPDGEPVSAFGGVIMTPQHEASEIDGCDLIVVPGTIDVEAALADRSLARSVAELTGAARISASVCTGAFLLAEVGLLAERPWTTHWEDIPALAQRLGTSGQEERVVDSGDVITSGGIGCGIDLGLHVIARFADVDLATAVARQIDVPWASAAIR